MIKIKQFVLLIGISIVSQTAVAQWTYTLTITANSSPTITKCGPFSSKTECEQNRQYDIAANTWSYYMDLGEGRGGTLKAKATATPCTGPGGGDIGSINIMGVDKGSSFNSTNPVNEINDWYKDHMEQMLALNPKYDSKEPETVATGDNNFDRIIENMPYSDEAFSGRMPAGSTVFIEKPKESMVEFAPPSKNLGVRVSDDFTDKPSNVLGDRHSADLKPINIELRPIKNTGYKEEESAIQKTLRTIDEKMDWYQAEDGNTLQYLYTKGKENVKKIGDWWNNSNISSRISNTLSTITDVIKDDGISAAVKMVFKPEYQNLVDNAYDVHSTVSGSIKDVFEKLDAKTIVDKAAKGETMDITPITRKYQDNINGLAVRISGIPDPASDFRRDIEKKGIKALDKNNIIPE